MNGRFGDLLPELKRRKYFTEIVLRSCDGYALRAGFSACLEQQPVVQESGKWFSAAEDAGCADRVLSRAGHGLMEEPEQKVLTDPEIGPDQVEDRFGRGKVCLFEFRGQIVG